MQTFYLPNDCFHQMVSLCATHVLPSAPKTFESQYNIVKNLMDLITFFSQGCLHKKNPFIWPKIHIFLSHWVHK